MSLPTHIEKVFILLPSSTHIHIVFVFLSMAKQRILQNNRLVWVDINIRDDDPDTQHTLEQLRTTVHQIDLFTQIDQCLQFLHEVKNEQVLIITSGSLGPKLSEKTHHLRQVVSIYIFCGNPDRHRSWTSEWSKIRGVYNRIKPICEALQKAVKQTNGDLTPMSFITRSANSEGGSTDNLNRLEPSFMYTTLFKRIFLDMQHGWDERKAIVKFCRDHYAGNIDELKVVGEFSREYRPDKAIWWYTRECFTFKMLNRALRLLESDIIVDMGFFIHDLHRQLEQLHREQFSTQHAQPLTLYRGQALSNEDFTKLQKSRGGLLAFNSFLSTSTLKSVSLDFARQNSTREDIVGIFFVMNVDPNIPSATFADIKKHSYFEGEGEILFSMHTVFRIDNVLRLGERLFEVRLTLTGDDDPELRQLTDRMEMDIGGGTGWERLGRVLIGAGQMNKAEELYLVLLKQNPSEEDQAHYYHHLGLIKYQQGDYKEALRYYERAISIEEKILSPTDSLLATSYNNIGMVYYSMGEYSQALSYYNKSLAIYEKTLPANHPDFAQSYNNIGMVYKNMGEYSQALSYYNKSLAIYEKTLPANHPDLATSNNNIGLVYNNIGEYSQSLSYYNKSLAIYEKTLPANHPDLATSNNNIGMVYLNMGEYPQALSYFNKSLAIREKTLPPDHPDLATSNNNIGMVYYSMGEYSEALSYYNKSLAIYEKTLPANHPLLATSNNNIGMVYLNMGEYPQTLSYFSKSLAIYEKTLPANHPDFAQSYNNIGMVYLNMGEYPQALSYFNKSLAIREKTLPPDHPDLATSNNNIGLVYYNMGEYSEALSYYNKSLAIYEKTLPANHPLLATSNNNIGMVYYDMGEYPQALSYFNKSLAIREKTLPATHPDFAQSYNNIGGAYYELEEYTKAKTYVEKALKIWKHSLPSGHPNIKTCEELLESVNKKLKK